MAVYRPKHVARYNPVVLIHLVFVYIVYWRYRYNKSSFTFLEPKADSYRKTNNSVIRVIIRKWLSYTNQNNSCNLLPAVAVRTGADLHAGMIYIPHNLPTPFDIWKKNKSQSKRLFPHRFSVQRSVLTFILLTWRLWWAPNNASRWQIGFNWAFKWLKKYNH